MRSECNRGSLDKQGKVQRSFWRGVLPGALCVAATALPAQAIHVYIMSSGDAAWDAALQSLLTAHGHTSTVGPRFWEFDGTESLAGVDAVYLSGHATSADELLLAMGGFVPGQTGTYEDYSPTPLQATGHDVLRNWVENGGGLVTTGATQFTASLPSIQGAPAGYPGAFATLETVFPTELLSVIEVAVAPTTAYEQLVADSTLNDGVAALFFFSADASDGLTEYPLIPRQSATTFYSTHAIGVGGTEFSHGVVGWTAGAGRAISFSIDAGPLAMADSNAGRLLVNALVWASLSDETCVCELDGDDAQLDVFDLLAYLDLWFASDPSADINTAPGIDVFDLLEFLDCWFSGC